MFMRFESIERNCILSTNRQLCGESKEVKNKIILAIPLLKEQKIEYILEKATELGVRSFKPYICERSIREKAITGKDKAVGQR